MADITIQRAYFGDCTLGRIRIKMAPDLYFASLELPHKGNAPDVSCVPEGLYPYRVAFSDTHKRPVIWVDDVPGRFGVQGHAGNFTADIKGCFLPGDGIKDLNGDGVPDVTNSSASLSEILKLIPQTGYIRFTNSEQPGQGVYV